MFEPLPPGPFGIILADPPWRFGTWSDKGKGRSAERHYPCLSLAQLKALPVQELAGKDAVLFLWVTVPKLVEGLELLQAWSFTYKSNYAWDKGRQGTGWWARNAHEHLLIGTCGKPRAPAPRLRQSSLIVAKVGKHSVKPMVVHEIIESQYPQPRKVELFARRERPGWVSWGNEVVPCDDE